MIDNPENQEFKKGEFQSTHNQTEAQNESNINLEFSRNEVSIAQTHNFQEYQQNNLTMNSEALKYQQDQQFIPLPKKLVCLSILLSIVGTIFLVLGFVDFFALKEREKGTGFIFFGTLMSIPGYYYNVQFYLAYNASSPEERAQYLEDVPQVHQ